MLAEKRQPSLGIMPSCTPHSAWRTCPHEKASLLFHTWNNFPQTKVSLISLLPKIWFDAGNVENLALVSIFLIVTGNLKLFRNDTRFMTSFEPSPEHTVFFKPCGNQYLEGYCFLALLSLSMAISLKKKKNVIQLSLAKRKRGFTDRAVPRIPLGSGGST